MLSAASTAAAHGGHGEVDEQRWTHWKWDPPVLAVLLIVTGLYVAGVGRLWWRAGVGTGVRRWQAACFLAGVAAIVAALLSPLSAISEQLSWVHMVQHKILMMIAAPLMVLGAPVVVMLWSWPGGQRRTLGDWLHRLRDWRPARYMLWQPLLLWGLFAFTLWVWHLPPLYEAALRNEWIHHFQHLGFFVTACLFWRVLLDPLSRLRMSPPAGALYLFATSLHACLLGIFMTLAPQVWYPMYAGRTELWGVAPMHDQQLAGLIMWMPACALYAGAAAVIFGLWLRDRDPAPAASRRPLQSPQPAMPPSLPVTGTRRDPRVTG